MRDSKCSNQVEARVKVNLSCRVCTLLLVSGVIRFITEPNGSNPENKLHLSSTSYPSIVRVQFHLFCRPVCFESQTSWQSSVILAQIDVLETKVNLISKGSYIKC